MGAEINLQCLLGLQCKDFVMVASDQVHSHGIIVLKNDESKLHNINERLLMGVIGNAGDTRQFTQFIIKNLELYRMRNKYELDTPAAVHFTRKNIGDGLRSGNPCIINMLIAGYDDHIGGQLYILDILGTCVKVPFASHGFGGIICLGIMDRYYRPTLTEKEAYDVLKLCVQEIHQKLVFNLPSFQVKVVSRSGIRQLPNINTATFAASESDRNSSI